ncbi:hypothetical protein [Pseudochrobactrum sp. HB0163]|uniref:hypothetical protein n=1 Tax=Pseudochrobactrum sp. HB0163 TaxID=3450708 RepID=UPI003F6E24AA
MNTYFKAAIFSLAFVAVPYAANANAQTSYSALKNTAIQQSTHNLILADNGGNSGNNGNNNGSNNSGDNSGTNNTGGNNNQHS